MDKTYIWMGTKTYKEDNYVVLEKKVNFQYFKFEFVEKWNVIID